jgi:hypothetical protein
MTPQQQEKLALLHREKSAHFQANREEVLLEIRGHIDAAEYRKAVSVLKSYMVIIDDPDLTVLHTLAVAKNKKDRQAGYRTDKPKFATISDEDGVLLHRERECSCGGDREPGGRKPLRLKQGTRLAVLNVFTRKATLHYTRWFQVKYRGRVGWISEYRTDQAQDLPSHQECRRRAPHIKARWCTGR